MNNADDEHFNSDTILSNNGRDNTCINKGQVHDTVANHEPNRIILGFCKNCHTDSTLNKKKKKLPIDFSTAPCHQCGLWIISV